MNRSDRRYCLTHTLTAYVCAFGFFVNGLRYPVLQYGAQVFLSPLGQRLNTRYKNGVLLLFTTLTYHEYRWDENNRPSEDQIWA